MMAVVLLVASWPGVAQDEADKDRGGPIAGTGFAALVHADNADGARESVLWQIPLGKPAVRRRILGTSPWRPSPALDSPELLRWQRSPEPGERPRRYMVEILAVDYAAFSVRRLLRIEQASAIGRSADQLYLNTANGQRILDVATGTTRELAPKIEVLAKHGDDWLVETEGHLARYDALGAKVVRHYREIPAMPRRARRQTIWKGERFAVRRGGFFDAADQPIVALEFQKLAVIYQDLRVCDLATGVETSVRVRTQGMGGSGVGVIARDLPIELVGGLFRYVERLPAAGDHADLEAFDLARDTEWVTIDVATGKELLRVPYAERDLDEPDRLASRGVPDYLRAAFDGENNTRWPGIKDIAFEFLAFHEIDGYGIRGVCRTSDKNELLILQGDTLYHANLKTRKLRDWPAPKAWQKVVGIALFAVPQP
ncbi:MAG: hypothetical protein NXI31_02655 [bacterium]|nr:hypothetical protein [bacterium]